MEVRTLTQIRIEFSRFSAFYSPLIGTIAAGFLEEEGLEPEYRVSPPGKSAIASLLDGTSDVVQSAPAQGFLVLERGGKPDFAHFAQINEMDGFFIAAREPDPDFSWSKLAGEKVLVDHFGQPLAMFKYACHKSSLDYAAIDAVDAGDVDSMDAAFRAGEGAYIHQQGPAPQQLEHDGVGHVVASVGAAIGPCAFSSLAGMRDWLETDTAAAFMRAYRKSRAWVNDTPAAEIARAEKEFFPDIHTTVLTDTIAFYQGLGCWTPHVEITPEAYEATQDVFLHAGLITRKHPYEEVVSPPPSA